MHISAVTKLSGPQISDTYNGRSKRTVQPSTTLTDKLSGRFRYIGFGLARLDISQSPLVARFSHQFETQDTILGQEHILGEDTHAVNTLWSQAIRERMVTVKVLLERPALNGAIAVGRESSGKDGYVAERRLKGLIEDVRHLVLHEMRNVKTRNSFSYR